RCPARTNPTSTLRGWRPRRRRSMRSTWYSSGWTTASTASVRCPVCRSPKSDSRRSPTHGCGSSIRGDRIAERAETCRPAQPTSGGGIEQLHEIVLATREEHLTLLAEVVVHGASETEGVGQHLLDVRGRPGRAHQRPHCALGIVGN